MTVKERLEKGLFKRGGRKLKKGGDCQRKIERVSKKKESEKERNDFGRVI